jgi:hypothetical protein
LLSVVPCPRGWGAAPPFIGKKGAVYMRATLFPYVRRHGEQCHGADVYPGESRSCWGVMARPVPVQERLRGWRRSGWSSGHCPWADSRVPLTGGTYVAQWQSWRGLIPARPNSVGTSSQCPAWCGSGGDGRTGSTATGMTDPAGLTSRRGPA